MALVNVILFAKEGGGEEPSASWSWIRFLVDDITLWGFALLCSIVLPLDEGSSGRDICSSRTISVWNRECHLSNFPLRPQKRGTGHQVVKHIDVFSPNDFFLKPIEFLMFLAYHYTISLFTVVTIWICLGFLITRALVPTSVHCLNWDNDFTKAEYNNHLVLLGQLLIWRYKITGIHIFVMYWTATYFTTQAQYNLMS